MLLGGTQKRTKEMKPLGNVEPSHSDLTPNSSHLPAPSLYNGPRPVPKYPIKHKVLCKRYHLRAGGTTLMYRRAPFQRTHPRQCGAERKSQSPYRAVGTGTHWVTEKTAPEGGTTEQTVSGEA